MDLKPFSKTLKKYPLPVAAYNAVAYASELSKVMVGHSELARLVKPEHFFIKDEGWDELNALLRKCSRAIIRVRRKNNGRVVVEAEWYDRKKKLCDVRSFKFEPITGKLYECRPNRPPRDV